MKLPEIKKEITGDFGKDVAFIKKKLKDQLVKDLVKLRVEKKK